MISLSLNCIQEQLLLKTTSFLATSVVLIGSKVLMPGKHVCGKIMFHQIKITRRWRRCLMHMMVYPA